jgi:hypothetical protein
MSICATKLIIQLVVGHQRHCLQGYTAPEPDLTYCCQRPERSNFSIPGDLGSFKIVKLSLPEVSVRSKGKRHPHPTNKCKVFYFSDCWEPPEEWKARIQRYWVLLFYRLQSYLHIHSCLQRHISHKNLLVWIGLVPDHEFQGHNVFDTTPITCEKISMVKVLWPIYLQIFGNVGVMWMSPASSSHG